MNSPGTRYILRLFFLFIVFISVFAGTCNRGFKKIAEEKALKEAQATKTKNAIKQVLGIKFTEVRRRYDQGQLFNPVGYQLVPEWRISFPTMDSVNIYSPKLKKFLNAPLVFDHDSVFNVAWAWLKLRYVSKDSMQFMVLHVHNNIIQDEKEHVFMTFYSNHYITDVLHSDTAKLWRPSAKDTLFIKQKTLEASKNPEKAFAGTQPATLIPRSPLVTVKKEPVPDEVDGGQSFDSYMSPTFDISIRKAYQDFAYEFNVYVDEKGNLIFRKSQQASYPEYVKSTNDIMRGITNGYLKAYLKVTPGKTLGIPHTSIIFINVSGSTK